MAVQLTATDYSGTGTGAAATYGTGIYANASDQIKVYIGGALKTIGDDYSLSGIGSTGGVDVLGTFALGAAVYVERVTPITQLVDTQNNETILEDVLDAEFDKLTMIAQEASGRVDRAILFPKGEAGLTLPAAAARLGKFIGFDPVTGAPILSGGTGTTTDAQLIVAADAASGSLFTTVQGFINKILSSAGTSIIGFVQAGGGAVLRALQAKLREVSVSITDYGAAMDGVTDDAAAWNKAITYLVSIGGGVLDIPPGKTLLNSTVNINFSGIWVRGRGHGLSWIVNGQTNAPALKFGDGVSIYNRNRLSDVVFGQKSGVVAVAGNCGLYCAKQSNFMLDGLQVFQFPSSLYDGVVFDAVTQSYMNTVGIQGCTNRGMYLFNQTFDIYMVNGRCDSSAYGIEFRDCQGIQGANWTAYGNSVNAYRFTTSGSVDNNQFFFLTNFIGDTSGQHNWKIEQLSLSTLTNCWAATQLVPITGGNYDGFYLSGVDVEDITFNGCIAISNNRHGMNIDFANRVQVIGGFYGSNFKPSAFGGLGARNGMAGAGSGILVGALADRVSIKGGKAENNASYGIDVVAGATKIEIEGIETRFNVTGAIRNNANATTAECRIKNVPGYSPIGFIAAPAVPASNTAITNLTGVDVMVYLVGGTLTGNVQINGHGVLAVTDVGYYLPAGGTIRLTYSVVPDWSWNGV